MGVGKRSRKNSEFTLSYKTLGCEEKREKRTKARERPNVWSSILVLFVHLFCDGRDLSLCVQWGRSLMRRGR